MGAGLPLAPGGRNKAEFSGCGEFGGWTPTASSSFLLATAELGSGTAPVLGVPLASTPESGLKLQAHVPRPAQCKADLRECGITQSGRRDRDPADPRCCGEEAGAVHLKTVEGSGGSMPAFTRGGAPWLEHYRPEPSTSPAPCPGPASSTSGAAGHSDLFLC